MTSGYMSCSVPYSTLSVTISESYAADGRTGEAG